jgi:CRISPR/Cas system-associated exonuclease Cas4 (RecB family)
MSQQDAIVRASEISQYAYCARAWWYARVKGYRPANVDALREGVSGHRAHGRAVAGSTWLLRLALLLLVIAGVLLAAWLVLGSGG